MYYVPIILHANSCVHVHGGQIKLHVHVHVHTPLHLHTRTHTFNLCHKFSIGFASGDSGGVRHQLIPLSVKNACARRDVCFGSLSCMKR